MLAVPVLQSKFRPLTPGEMNLVSGGLLEEPIDVGGDPGDGGGGSGGQSTPSADPAHWFDGAASQTTSWNADQQSFETDYFNADGSYMGAHWSTPSDAELAAENGDAAGWYVTMNVGEGIVGGVTLAVDNDGLDAYFQGGYGTGGISGGYTADLDDYLSGWSLSGNGPGYFGGGMSVSGTGSVALGMPGGAFTYGISFEDLAALLDHVILDY